MSTSTLWSPITVGEIQLKHRVVLAPLTRNRATPSMKHGRTWVASDLMKQYYEARATDGGLLISEATPISVVASALPGVPGIFTMEQVEAWKPVVAAVHAKGGLFFCQLWHQGRATHSTICGQQPVSSSNVPMSGTSTRAKAPFEVPRALTIPEIHATQQDFVNAAILAVAAGFDGVELHAANGYLFDQFHHTNINLRSDEYGGTLEKRCRFTLETTKKVAAAIGAKRVAVRLAPWGFFQQTFGEQREEQWVYLCQELSQLGLAYVHLVEPRFDELKSEAEKLAALDAGAKTAGDASLRPFRSALGTTPLMVAGGYTGTNSHEGVAAGDHDLVAFGRYFISNPDLVERLREGLPLYHYNRARFYGPFDDPEVGYTVQVRG